MKYSYRYIARIVIEAEKPLAVGSGNQELTSDRPVAKDANGIPYIPGTSLAGVMRHAIYEHAGNNTEIVTKWDDIFGFQDKNAQENSRGSRLSISSAHLMGKQGKVFDGLLVIPEDDINYDFINRYRNLPVRQHVHMNHKGAADTDKHGKFDEEVLYKGSRFIFELEMRGKDADSEADKNFWKHLLLVFSHPDFRIGGGSTKGFGRIRVIEIKDKILNLDKTEDREFYLKHSTCLDDEFLGDPFEDASKLSSSYILYQLHLIPEDFYLFSSGLKTDTADMNPVMEEVLDWTEADNPKFSEEMVLIPATSVKGAISHRVAYHFNKESGVYADQLPDGKSLTDFTGENNLAVKALFGVAADYSEQEDGQKGNVLFSDVYRKNCTYKKLDHVAIDRYTGGAIEGALFNENTVIDAVDDKNEFILEFQVKRQFMDGQNNDVNIKNAFEMTLDDIVKGSLPLGGGTMRGNGVFKEKITKNNN